MIREVNEEELLQEIGSGKKIVLDVWMDNCPHCEIFAPIFEEVSEEVKGYHFLKYKLNRDQAGPSKFKKIYMKVEKGVQKNQTGAPAIFIFEDAKNRIRHHGRVDAQTLKSMISGEWEAKQKEKTYSLTQSQALQLEGMLGELPLKFGFQLATFLKSIFSEQDKAQGVA